MNSSQASDARVMDVLIVDNVRLYRRIVEHMFVNTCLRVNFAENGAAALDLTAFNEFSIVCGAMHLPDMTGLELCRQLRRLPKGRATPFVLLTSEAPEHILAEAYAAGVTDVIERDSPGPLVTMMARQLAHREPIAGKVLVVEDEASQAAFVRAALASIGLDCDIAASAEQALPLLKARQYDLVVLDLVLAGAMSGVMLASQIRRLEGEHGEVPILATTGFDDLSRRIELFRLGVDDYVGKPIVIDELTARARRLIGHFRLVRKMRAECNEVRAETAAAHPNGVPTHDTSGERIALREGEHSVLPDLLAALDEGRVALFTQRIAPLHTWQARQGHEFLCRIVTPGGQLMEPPQFLPTAERHGLMRRLDRHVTGRAIEWLAERQNRLEEGALDFYTINLSGQTVGDLDFVGFVRERLQATGVPAERIYFEITESAVIDDPNAAEEFMALMGRLGCRFALDNFGSGTASYGRLRQLPVQLIKIDGRFVTHLLDNALDRAIVRSTREVARALGLPTIAEFVESEAQIVALRAIGVDYVQGYGIGLPGPVAAQRDPSS